MISISHWGLFCWPAGVSVAAIEWAKTRMGKPWFPAAPSDFYFGP